MDFGIEDNYSRLCLAASATVPAVTSGPLPRLFQASNA